VAKDKASCNKPQATIEELTTSVASLTQTVASLTAIVEKQTAQINELFLAIASMKNLRRESQEEMANTSVSHETRTVDITPRDNADELQTLTNREGGRKVMMRKTQRRLRRHRI
jgi:hypothetical protein